MDHPIVHAKTIFNRIKEAHLDQRGDSLAASSLPLKKKLDFLYRIADQHTVFRVMAGAMTPEPDGQHFRSRAELADEASRLDVGEVVDVQIEVGHGSTFQDERGAAPGGNDDRCRSGWSIVSRMRRGAPENISRVWISVMQV